MLDRRSLILASGAGLAAAAGCAATPQPKAQAQDFGATSVEGILNVRHFGATGDGTTIDTPAINRAIEDAAARGGGTVYFPPGKYACFTIRLKSKVSLYLEQGAIIYAAPAPPEGTSGGYDHPEPIDPSYANYQDFGHGHWRNSLIWGEGLSDITIAGDGLIDGTNLARGDGSYNYMDDPHYNGTGNKAIALKWCRNVLLRDFRVYRGGWFALLATGVDNMTIDNLIVDTTRDGFDIDCCRNVRVTNCHVNSPWDDGICLKSSYALGEARATENVMIANCYVTGNYEIGSLIDATWKKMPPSFASQVHGRIKFGTESNGGYKNITITNCTFEDSQGFALETVDGGDLEDVTISNCTMRGNYSSPIFLRLGRRMRGPKGAAIAKFRRILISNIVSSSSAPLLPSIIAGIPGHPVEDVKIADCYFHQEGGAPENLVNRVPPLEELGYPEPNMFGDLPATGFYIRDAKNVEMSNIEVAVEKADPRAAFWLQDVEGADFFRLRVPGGAPSFHLSNVSKFRNFGSLSAPEKQMESVQSTTIF
jgi:polygalacturonase